MRPRLLELWLPARWAGGGVEMTTLWVETRAGHLTEGLQVSEDPASSQDRSRAHLFRERLALREHPLPDGQAPSSWVCVCAQVSRLPAAPSEPGRWFLLFVYEAPV